MAFRTIAAYAPNEVAALGLSLVGEVFSDRTRAGVPEFEFSFCSDAPGPVRTDQGFDVHIAHGLDRLATADLVLALPWNGFRTPPAPAVLAAFQAAFERGALVAGHCVGVYLLASAGLLDGKRVTTHWRFADELAAAYPRVVVDADVLYVDEGQVITGAGAAAGLDMCLHLLRREHGTAAANWIARDLVMPAHRPGGQAQYLGAPLPTAEDDDRLRDVLTWAQANLDSPLSLDDLAARALTSRRTFIRRFREATGSTPHSWLLAQRLDRAEHLLESTDLSIEAIARQVGYSSATALREQFVRRRGVPPTAHRRSFGQSGR